MHLMYTLIHAWYMSIAMVAMAMLYLIDQSKI